MLFIITLSTLNKFISKALLENDKKHDNLFPCPFITLGMPHKIYNLFIFIKRHDAVLYQKGDNEGVRKIILGCCGD